MSRVTLPNTRFTLAEFERLVAADAFGTERVELLDGRLHFMTQRRPHMAAVSKTSDAILRVRRQSEWLVIRGTLRLDRFNAPDPDLLWLPVPIDTPEHEWPSPILLIEISDTTYKKDSGRKLRKYTQALVSDYWILNLNARRVEVYRDPQTGSGALGECRYASVTHHGKGDVVTPSARADVSFRVDDLLP